VNAAPVTGVAFGLVSVMVSTEVAPTGMAPGANAFATVRPESTVRVALAAAVLAPAFAVVRPPAAMPLA
jgi:hypothetical protein